MTSRYALFAAILCLVLGEVFSAPPAHADDRPPRFDEDSHCRRLSLTNDGLDSNLMTRCLVQENDAQDQIRRQWADTPAYIQDDCVAVSRADRDENYVQLQRCLHDQLHQQLPTAVPQP